MSREWTAAQKAAIETTGRTLLISAAAGAGKTATLTERIIRRLTDPEHPAELSRLLIVTFTRAAAAELKTRISEALTEAIARHPESSRLQRQLLNLGNAHICTIDSFCYDAVRSHFSETKLPASFRLADKAELDPLADKLMEQLIEEFFRAKAVKAQSGEDLFALLDENPFADLVDALTSSKDDSGLTRTLINFYERLLNFPAGVSRLKEEADRLRTAADKEFFDAPQGKLLKAWKEDFCVTAVSFYKDALEYIANDPQALKAYDAGFRSDSEFMARLDAAKTYDEVQRLVNGFTPAKLTAYRGKDEYVKKLKDRRTQLCKVVTGKMKDRFAWTAAEASRDMRRTADMCELLYELLDTFDTRFTEEKRRRGICDFTDNRRNLLAMLMKSDGTPTAICDEFRSAYDEVYVDEYQDVDEVQDTIFSLVGGAHRFMVGDIKQSIYGFRGADPSVFSGYRTRFPSLVPGATPLPDGEGQSIFMSDNFRCDESVIRVTNAVCGHIFSACPDTVGYRPEDDLGFGKRPPSAGYRAENVEIDVLFNEKTDKKSKDAEASGDASGTSAEDKKKGPSIEDIFVANRIASLLREKTRLADGEVITAGDVAVLARTNDAYEGLAEAMAAVGVPFGSDVIEEEKASRDLLHSGDMTYLVNLLRVLDDPDNDVPLSEVLRAPFPGFTLDEVIIVRDTGRTTDHCSLYESVCSYPERENPEPTLLRKVLDFTSWLEGYRSLLPTLTADGILRLLRQDPKVAARRSRAFLYLYDAARTCRVGSFTGVYSFLRYFERKRENEKRVQTEETVGKKNHVTFMTIHGSKGLEFPVVFLVDCGASLTSHGGAPDLLFHKTTGMAMRLYDRPTHAKCTNVLHKATELARGITEREEEMRLLYVAMTRARERLILTGTGKEEIGLEIARGDRFSFLECGSYLEWVRTALLSNPRAMDYVTMRFISASEVTPDEPLPPAAQIKAVGDAAAAADFYRRLQEMPPEDPTQRELLAHVPTKVSASHMERGMLDKCVFLKDGGFSSVDEDKENAGEEDGEPSADVRTLESLRASIRLMSSSDVNEFELLLAADRKPTSAEKGTATHLFLQFCDYGRVAANGLDAEIAHLLNEGFINSRTADIIDRAQLKAFFESNFFARLSSAVRVEREFRFARFVPLRTLTSNPALADALGDRTLYVQGSVDLIAEYADGSLEICDYKTDRITEEERADRALLTARMKERHGVQLEQYVAAVTGIFGRKPTAVSIYSLPLGEAVPVG